MTMDPILNELSFHPPASDVYAAQQGMESLVRTAITAAKYGLNGALRSHDVLVNIYLAPEYTIHDWLNDRRVDQVLRSRFRLLGTKAPYLADLPEKEEAALTVMCYCDEDEAVGLKVAYMLDTVALSVPFIARWNRDQVSIIIRALNSDGEWLPDETAEVFHASAPAHVKTFEEWLRSRLRPDINSGRSLWLYHAIAYPDLEFCAAVEKQLDELVVGDERLGQVRRLLTSLNDYTRSWTEGRFDSRPIKGTPSPENALTLATYGRERTFLCLDGQERIFSWHQKMYDINWRIHFYPDEERKQIIVGYIGRHLPTPDYHT